MGDFIMIVSFSDGVQKFEHTGTKSYTLAKVLKLGFKVPNYICITKEDCKNNIINPETLKELLNILEKNFKHNTLYAIRSSSNLQDVDDVSFNGQFETFLNVPIEDLEKYINQCLASIQSKRICSYIKRHNITQNPEMNVIVQEMLPQNVSGVMYTSNPIGILSEKVIIVGSGNCNDISEDKQNFNTYYQNTDGEMYSVQNNNIPTITSTKLNELYTICEILQQNLDKYLRIDFCISNDTIYILQVNKITNLKLDSIITLHKTKIIPDYNNTTYPLTISFVKQCHNSVFSNLILHLTNSPEIVKDNQDTINHILSIYNGRVFYNINNLYKIFSLIPFSNKITPLLEKELDVNNDDEIYEDSFSGNTTKIAYTLSIFKIMTSTPKKLKNVNNSFSEVEKIFNDCYCEELSDIQLKSLYKVLFSKTVTKWDTDIINSIYCYFNSYILKKFFKKNIDIYSSDINTNVELEKGLAGTFQQRILNGLYNQETNKENQEKVYGYIQKIFLHMGLNLVNLGYLEDEKDVYYLTIEELFDEGIHSYKDIVSQRKNLYNFYNKLPNYKIVSFDGKVLSKNITKNGQIIIL